LQQLQSCGFLSKPKLPRLHDQAESASMLDYSQIQLVFRDSTKFYSAELVKEIETLRKTFGGILFIDRVLAALGLAKGTALSHSVCVHLSSEQPS
jgi:predicted O-methyltransferase YrrM